VRSLIPFTALDKVSIMKDNTFTLKDASVATERVLTFKFRINKVWIYNDGSTVEASFAPKKP